MSIWLAPNMPPLYTPHLEEVDELLHDGDVRVELHLARAVQDEVVLLGERAQLLLWMCVVVVWRGGVGQSV